MGKHLQRQDSCFGSNRAGCMWSLMHIFDNHDWTDVKKILPHRKRAGGRRVRCNHGSRKATLNTRDIGKRDDLAVADAEPLLVKHQSTQTSSAKNRSGISRVKASSGNAKPREESAKGWILCFPVQSWLWRTSVGHDVEPSENCLDKTRSSAGASPSRSQDSSPNKKLTRINQMSKDISSLQFDDHLDILKIFKVNKDILLRILQDPDVNTDRFPGLQGSKKQIRLIKSRSFPLADSSRARNIRPSTLKHKQNEVWLFPKGGKLFAGTSESHEDYSMTSMHNMTGIDNVGSDMKQETSFSSLGLPEGFSHQGWNQLVINRFRDITQKLMHLFQESKKENVHPSIKALFQENPSGCDIKEQSESLKTTVGQQIDQVDGFDDNLGMQRLYHIRRSSSLNESLNRYTQLFERSYSSDQSKVQRSRSLKLKGEEKFPSTGNAQKSTRRNLSLPDLDSFCSILNGTPKGAFRLGMPVKNVVDNKTDKSGQLDAIVEEDFENNMDERSGADILGTKEATEYAVEPALGESRTHHEQEIGTEMNSESELAQPIENYFFEPCSSDNITTSEFSISKGSNLNPRSAHVDESDSSIDLQTMDSVTASCNTINTGMERKNVDNHSPKLGIEKMDDLDSEFSYVRYVLELSGFIGHEDLGTWYSLDQPLDPTLFKELEDCFQHEPGSYENQVSSGILDHQLLFDLVNETLLDVYESSYTYFPRALSFSGRIRPMPKGHHLLDDVWKRVSSYLSLRPEMDQSLDDVVARDFAKDERWMNLQWETECVTLELEDLIFDELLDEVICT